MTDKLGKKRMSREEAVKIIEDCIGDFCDCPVQKDEVKERCEGCRFYDALMVAIPELYKKEGQK